MCASTTPSRRLPALTGGEKRTWLQSQGHAAAGRHTWHAALVRCLRTLPQKPKQNHSNLAPIQTLLILTLSKDSDTRQRFNTRTPSPTATDRGGQSLQAALEKGGRTRRSHKSSLLYKERCLNPPTAVALPWDGSSVCLLVVHKAFSNTSGTHVSWQQHAPISSQLGTYETGGTSPEQRKLMYKRQTAAPTKLHCMLCSFAQDQQ